MPPNLETFDTMQYFAMAMEWAQDNLISLKSTHNVTNKIEYSDQILGKNGEGRHQQLLKRFK